MSTVADLNTAIGGHWLPEPAAGRHAERLLGRIETDSRRIEPGDVFWALRGPNHDGSDFAADAFRRGAAGAVVGKPVDVPEACWAMRVADTQQALHHWAMWKRRQFSGTAIGVTGSVGKTTTRQMIHTVLQTRFRGTASPQNYNNHVGVPLSMLGMESDHDYAVLELGASRPGEIATLAEMCAPKVGVITRIGDAHLHGFGSRRKIAESKAELLAALPSDGRAVLGDDPWLWTMARDCKAPITLVGTSHGCDLRATDVESGQGRLRFTLGGCKFHVPVWGRHHLTAALLAVAVGRMMGFDFDEMADVLEDFQPVPMRCEVREVRGATLINDAYNSNPTAMKAALELLGDFDTTGRRIVVCGDMGELGDESPSLHWQIGKQIVTLGGADVLVACGQFARHVVAGARAAGLPQARSIPCPSIDDALPYLGQSVLPGDVVLIKGSRIMAMERVVAALEQYPQRRTA